MNKMLATICALGCAALNLNAATANKSDLNLIKDGSFELPLKAHNRNQNWGSLWTLPQGCSLVMDQKNPAHGRQSLRMAATKPSKVFQINQKLTKLKPNTRYRLTCEVRHENIKSFAEYGGARINVITDRNKFFPKAPLLGTSSWKKYSFEFVSEPNTNQPGKRPAHLMLWLADATGTVWFDNFTLTELPAAK